MFARKNTENTVLRDKHGLSYFVQIFHMKHTLLSFGFLLCMALPAFAQKAAEPKKLTKAMTLTIDRAGGANGAGVVWHPVQKKYYAAQAGNADFPMMVFDATGKKLSDEDLKTGIDIRGFWYNPATKALQITTYDNAGWFEYNLDSKGIPEAKKNLNVTTTQPDPQSVGIYNPLKKVVYYYDYSTMSLESHGMDGSVGLSKIKLYLGMDKKHELGEEALTDLKAKYSENAPVYTGIAKAEIGMLNVADKKVELYDLSTGLMTRTLKLPDDAPCEYLLDFCYTNGMYWLFDKSARVWYAYK